MQNNTKKKIAPVVVTVVSLLYLGPIAAVLMYLAGTAQGEGLGGLGLFVLLYAAALCALMVGILLALSQRLKEIDGGEEDDAKQY